MTTVWLLFAWLEWRRPNRSYVGMRIFAITMASVSLALLGMGLPRKTVTGVVGLMVTEGAKDTSSSATRQYTYETYLASGDTSVRKWLVTGYGLSEAQLQYLKPEITGHIYEEPKAGIRSAGWQQQLAPGGSLQVQGHCFNRTGKEMQLALEGYAALQDSIRIPAGKEIDFRLRSAVKHAGRAVFHLQLKNGKELIENNPVPFLVTEPGRIRVLVLASSPDFEYRFLQRWLGENGFTAVVRTATSKNKYQQSFINRNAFPLSKLSVSLLDSFDVLLADEAALNNIASDEKAAVRQQVGDKGLGLLLRTDTAFTEKAFYSKGFRFRSVVPRQQQLVAVLTQTSDSLPAVSLNQFLSIQPQDQLQQLIGDKEGHLLAASALYGTGRITVSTLANTFNWQLAGQPAAYAAYWTYLLEQLARKQTPSGLITIPQGFYRLGGSVPVTVVAAGNADTGLLVTDEGIRVHTARDTRVPYLLHGDFWPLHEGWQRIGSGQAAAEVYVFGKSDWPMVRAYRHITATKEWISRQTRWGKEALPYTPRPFNPCWLIGLFLLAAGFLWAERKFLS
ncbi:hypothetical protein [Sediminibacterium soli]|uniref:hypothetical protein n=1 Tax=Sediminibacterium soli TaxID=2698829 RepID=UPI00137B0465|nr:hypothetical protein [Sediminibacterium soli]NCI45214.1 hypothetical protein [Sediminibacterium soli]